MFDTVAMSRLTVAAPVDRMAEVLNACTNLGCVHIEAYSNFEEGIHVGHAFSGEEADHVSALLSKVRAAISAYKPVNTEGPLSVSKVKELLEGTFSDDLQKGLHLLDTQRDAEAELAVLDEQIHALHRLVPLDMDLELLVGSRHVEVYTAETKKALKAASVFGSLMQKVQMKMATGIVAVACLPEDGAEVQMALGELGGKSVQIPGWIGNPTSTLKTLQSKRKEVEGVMFSASEDAARWARNHGRDLLAVHEYLSKIESIHTAPTQLAVTGQAFALDAWVPTSKKDEVVRALDEFASHIDVQAFVNDHGHHGHHDDDHGHHYAQPNPPVALENNVVSRPFELMVGLVGQPKYGSIDPTVFLMFTFPLIYGLILGDFGYGLIILALAFWLGSKPFAADPVAKHGVTILKWMGIWCIIWGILFAEGFGFVWDSTGQMGSSSPLAGLYTWTNEQIHFPEALAETLNLTHMHIPFHRATSSLGDYVLLSVYLGIAHLMFGFVLGFINVARAHGILAAFFEKGSWMVILVSGTLHIYLFLTDPDVDVFSATPFALTTVIGVGMLIIGLAKFEGFGAAGGLIMGPIETFGLLANTLSYLRVMAVGVAGVKIAEVSISMGWDLMISGDGIASVILGFVLFIFIQAFALALGLLSPSIHAARLHFVEWMGKFYDGSGRVFTPLGGRTLHTEGQS